MRTREKGHHHQSVVLLAGAEVFLIEEELSRLRSELEEHDIINFASYNCDDSVNIDEILGLCNTLPFLGDRRTIMVRNIHKTATKNLQQLVEYLENPSQSTTLVLTIEGEKIPQNIKKAVSRHGKITSFESLKGHDLITWIQKRSHRHGKDMDRDAAYLLNEVTGSNLWFMAMEIEKLSLFAGPHPKIRLSDVEQLVVRSQEPSIFSFMDALFDRKKDTLFRLYEIESSGTPELEIIKRIANQAILHYRLLFGDKEKKADVHPFVEKKILARKGTLSSSQLRSLLRDIRQMEHRVKTGMSVQPYVALCETLGKFLSSEKT